MLPDTVSASLAPVASRVALPCVRSRSTTGSSVRWPRIASNSGVSATCSRTYNPTPSMMTLSRNGTRHPQATSAPGGSRVISPNTSDESSSPPGEAAWGRLPQKPRLPAGACSMVSRLAPAYSPPSPIPCATRKITSRIGAQTPACAKVGSTPIRNVPAPMITSVAIRLVLRPIRSPMSPKINPPIGRATKPDAKAPNEAMVLSSGSPLGKNSGPKTSADAVAKT